MRYDKHARVLKEVESLPETTRQYGDLVGASINDIIAGRKKPPPPPGLHAQAQLPAKRRRA